MREIYTVSRSLYRAQYYGYLNSDILLSPSLIPVLEKLSQSYQQGELTDGVMIDLSSLLLVLHSRSCLRYSKW